LPSILFTHCIFLNYFYNAFLHNFSATVGWILNCIASNELTIYCLTKAVLQH
jgi:hypothetical protein